MVKQTRVVKLYFFSTKFFETWQMRSSTSNATHFFKIRPTSDFIAFLPLTLVEFLKNYKLVWGQISDLGSFRVKFRSSLIVGKLDIKMTGGHQRSPEEKNAKK